MSVETFLSLEDTCLSKLKGRRIIFGRISQRQLAISNKKDKKLNTGDRTTEVTSLYPVYILTPISSVTGGSILCLFEKQSAVVEKDYLAGTVIFRALAIHPVMQHCRVAKLAYLNLPKGDRKGGQLEI